MHFSELECEFLKEIFNQGAQRSLESLQLLTKDSTEIEISVPQVEAMALESMITALDEKHSTPAVSVKENFTGALEGWVTLILSEESSQNIIDRFIGDRFKNQSVSIIREDCLKEVGNILLNACLHTVGNFFEIDLTPTFPELLRGNWRELFANAQDSSNEVYILIDVDFNSYQTEIQGNLSLCLTPESLIYLVDRIKSCVKMG